MSNEVNTTHGLRRGQCVPDVPFVTVDDQSVRIADFKGRYNLLLVAARDPAHPLLDLLAQRQAEITERETVTIAFIASNRNEGLRACQRRGWPFLAAADPDGAVTNRLGIAPGETAAVCITDRWGEVFFLSEVPGGGETTYVDELLRWLDFVEYQCPECFPSEWPI